MTYLSIYIISVVVAYALVLWAIALEREKIRVKDLVLGFVLALGSFVAIPLVIFVIAESTNIGDKVLWRKK